MSSFRAYVVDHEDVSTPDGPRELPLEALGEDEVTIRVDWSSVNYKDALAASPKGRVARISPLIPGIDLAGEVIESSSPDIGVGQQVLAHGYDLGVSHHGGFSERARVPAGWVVPLPESLTAREAMAIGTAGYTAAQCIVALEERGLAPGDGEVLVLGASGGVGSVAVSILAGRGYTVAAVTGKPEQSDMLRGLGASEIIARDEVDGREGKPLERERWAGCVDAVGGAPLAYALRTLRYGAAAASCGNVAGGDLHTTIYPFILRGVSLLGIDSSQTPIETAACDLEPSRQRPAARDAGRLARARDDVGRPWPDSRRGIDRSRRRPHRRATRRVALLEADGLRRNAAARQRGRTAAGGERDRVVRLELQPEREREPRHERVAAAVGVLARAGNGCRRVRASGLHPAAEGAGGRDDEAAARARGRPRGSAPPRPHRCRSARRARRRRDGGSRDRGSWP